MIGVDIEKGICEIEETSYPMIGFGTYPLKGEACAQAVAHAIELGYRIIDTATRYDNFDAIAQALRGKQRADFYLISKVWHDHLTPAAIQRDLAFTLEALEMDYLDAYLIHWPNSQIPIEKTLAAMEELRQADTVRHLGLSNVTVHHLKRALEVGVRLTWVQVEMNPFFYDEALLELCQHHDIGVQAWAPLGRGRTVQDTLLVQIGEKYGKTPSQIALRWILQHGCLPLPASKHKEHMRENLGVGDFSLSSGETEEISARARMGERKRIKKEEVGFADEFDFSYAKCWPK